MTDRNRLRGAPTPLSAYSLRQILALSLVMVLAIAGTVALVANPTLAAGFAAGIVTAWARPRVVSLVERFGDDATEVRSYGSPAGE